MRAPMRWLRRPRQDDHAVRRARQLERTIDDAERSILDRCLPYTMTSPERLLALIDAVRYVTRRDLRGALVECGVWRGGSVLAMVLALQQHGVDDRDLWLYDTFTGMTSPTEYDTSRFDRPALESWREATSTGDRPWEALFKPEVLSRAGVEALLSSSGYPMDLVRIVEGDVLQTIPAVSPEKVALLRLDTDWYASTRHELEHLYPRLAVQGVLMVDDYGHWDGARRAVDEYLGLRGPLLHRVDYTCRVAIKG